MSTYPEPTPIWKATQRPPVERGSYRCRRCRPGFFASPAGAASSAGTAAGSPGGLAGGRVPSPNMSPHTSRAQLDASSSAGGGGGLVAGFVMGGMVARSAGSTLVPPTGKPLAMLAAPVRGAKIAETQDIIERFADFICLEMCNRPIAESLAPARPVVRRNLYRLAFQHSTTKQRLR